MNETIKIILWVLLFILLAFLPKLTGIYYTNSIKPS